MFFEALGKSEGEVDLIEQPNGNAFVSWEQKLPVAKWTKIDRFLLPRYDRDCDEAVIKQVSPAKVAAQLLENTINLRNFNRMGLGEVKGLVTGHTSIVATYNKFGFL